MASRINQTMVRSGLWGQERSRELRGKPVDLQAQRPQKPSPWERFRVGGRVGNAGRSYGY